MVSTPWNETLLGLVFAFDRTNQILVLQVPSKRDELEFRVVNIASGFVVSVQTTPSPQTRAAKFPPFDLNKARDREREAVAKSQAAALKIGKGVTAEAQQLFNAIVHIYPQTRWEGIDIIVMGEVSVRGPDYIADNVSSIKPNGESKLLRIVGSIVEQHALKRRSKGIK